MRHKARQQCCANRPPRRARRGRPPSPPVSPLRLLLVPALTHCAVDHPCPQAGTPSAAARCIYKGQFDPRTGLPEGEGKMLRAGDGSLLHEGAFKNGQPVTTGSLAARPALFASWSVPRALLTLQVYAGSLYRCRRST